MAKKPGSVFVWDLPTRLFHWCLVVLVSISLFTGLSGEFSLMDYHLLSGYGILGLVTFRLLWGVAGNQHARFLNFVRGPRRVMDYIKQLRAGQVRAESGHNPLGALSVVALLLVLLTQATTGLFATDDILLEGPLVHLVSGSTSGLLTQVHETVAWLIMGLVILHLLAIAFHTLARKESLIKPMLTGWRREPAGESNSTGTEMDRSATNPWFRGLLVAGFSAGAVYYLINYV